MTLEHSHQIASRMRCTRHILVPRTIRTTWVDKARELHRCTFKSLFCRMKVFKFGINASLKASRKKEGISRRRPPEPVSS